MCNRRLYLAVLVGLVLCLAIGFTPTLAEPVKVAKEITNSIGMKLVLIPPEKAIPPGKYYMGVYAVTQAEYEKVMGTNPSHFSAAGEGNAKVKGMDTSRFPVEMVGGGDAVTFCKKLSELPEEKAAGRVYRLPTSEEWTFCCRAGTTTKFYFGDTLSSEHGNVDRSLGRTTTVGSYAPNPFGLYDMHGNVWQWCLLADKPFEGEKKERVSSSFRLRGSSWASKPRYTRSSEVYLSHTSDFVHSRNRSGFRVVAVQADK